MSDDPVKKLLERAAHRGEARGAVEVWQRATSDAGRLSRRSPVRRAVLVAAAAAAVIGGAALTVGQEREPDSVITAGPRSGGIPLVDIPEGITPWVIGDQHAFISRDGDDFTVFVANTHHLPDDTLLWCQTDNLFTGAEHGEQFDRLGQKIGGPQRADLSRMTSEIERGHLLVDPSDIIPGAWILGPGTPAPPVRDHPPYKFSGCNDGVGGDDAIGRDPGRKRPQGSDTVDAFCDYGAQLDGERPASYVGSEQHVADIRELVRLAPDVMRPHADRYLDFLASGAVDPADEDSQLWERWPADVQASATALKDYLRTTC